MDIFGRKNKPKPKLPDDEGTKIMLRELENETKKEYNEIENFLNIIYENNYRGSPKFLNMTIEKFLEYLESKENELNTQLSLQANPQKITLFFRELNDVEQMKKFINNYIAFAQRKSSEHRLFSEINPQKTTLDEFIEILQSMQKYLKKLFQK